MSRKRRFGSRNSGKKFEESFDSRMTAHMIIGDGTGHCRRLLRHVGQVARFALFFRLLSLRRKDIFERGRINILLKVEKIGNSRKMANKY